MIAERTRKAASDGADVVLSEIAQKAERDTTASEKRVSPIARKAARKRVQQDEAYQAIQAYMTDFARELNDRAPLASTTSRAYNLYVRSGMNVTQFIDQLYAARAIVKERSANIRSEAKADPKNPWSSGLKHKTPYYFAVLEDLLGLREQDSSVSSPSGDNG
jgi:hypothetical protein